MVQIRDLDSWKRLPGVETGCLGPKYGFTSKDNGWAIFNQMRIPRTNMLMGLCEVSKEGEFSLVGDPRVLYSVMMYFRLNLVARIPELNWRSNKIMTRYCCVRRQFSNIDGQDLERKVIDYQPTTHQISRLVARNWISQVMGRPLIDEAFAEMNKIKSGQYDTMEGVHHVLAGFKALVCGRATDDCEVARRVCGGAGFVAMSGFANMFDMVSPIPIFEGDN